MGRLHLFEFSDQAWLPRVFRDLFTEYLSHLFSALRIYQSVEPFIRQVMEQRSTCHVIDLCSGASGPWPRLVRQLNGKGIRVSVTLTDKYPNVASFRRISEMTQGQIGYIEESVDPTESLPKAGEVYTLFSSFHHFRPEQSRAIVRNAVQAGATICVFEMTERRLSTVLLTLVLGPLVLLCLTPGIRPRSLRRLFWTYIIPIVPLVYTWDGVVSHLRTYSPAELHELADSVNGKGYRWEVGRIRSPRSSLFSVTYLLGYPG
jgi:hypothetical protein